MPELLVLTPLDLIIVISPALGISTIAAVSPSCCPNNSPRMSNYATAHTIVKIMIASLLTVPPQYHPSWPL